MGLTKLFTDKVNAMNAYSVQSSSGMIKLDAMEMPYTLPDDLKEALAKMLEYTNINRYPSSKATSLRKRIKQEFNISEGLGIMLGNGSDELISIILLALSRENATVLSVAPSFVMYKESAELLGMNYVSVDLNNDFTINESLFLDKIKEHNPAVIFISYPNNPTGNTFSKVSLQKIIEAAKGFVVIDEAYSAYAKDDCLDFVEKYDNVIMIRTVSKIGLAGIRLGYMVAKEKWIEEFNKARAPYNINTLTQVTANFVLEHGNLLSGFVEDVKSSKDDFYEWLGNYKELEVFPSETNFLLVRFEDSDSVFSELKSEYRILVKNMNGSHKLLKNILRITIGTNEEMQKTKDAIANILSK